MYIFAASLQRHKATHSDSAKYFTCDVCEKKFTKLEYLHNHYHETALSPNEFQCPNCEKAFLFKSGEYQIYQQPLPRDSPLPKRVPVSVKKLSCSRVASNLHNHCHDTALSPNEFQCPNCEKAFMFKSGEYQIYQQPLPRDSPLPKRVPVSVKKFSCSRVVSIHTTTATTQPSPQTSSSVLTVRKRSCSRVVSIRYTNNHYHETALSPNEFQCL